MNSSRWTIVACMAIAWCGIIFSQPKLTIAATVLSLPDDQADPGYAVYKAGYNLILDESWQDARRELADMITKYPKSEYVDDAQYWSAYALMHIDRKKAVEVYKKFLKGYPKSSYYDDAVADLGQLNAPVAVTSYSGASGSSITVGAGEQAVVTDEGVVVSKAPRGGISYGFSSGMRHLSRELRRGGMHLPMSGHIAPTPLPDDQKIDPETRLKMEALYAIGETKEDEKSFQTLRDVALDLKQSRQLREAAMDALSEFKKFDVLPVYIDIARKDTSRDLQMYAIDYIGEHGKDKNKTVDVLVDLFNSVPKQRTEQVETIFYAIAEVGNDKAVDFLTKVALTNEDYDLRTNAVYLLGSIGGEKARTSLYQILKGK